MHNWIGYSLLCSLQMGLYATTSSQISFSCQMCRLLQIAKLCNKGNKIKAERRKKKKTDRRGEGIVWGVGAILFSILIEFWWTTHAWLRFLRLPWLRKAQSFCWNKGELRLRLLLALRSSRRKRMYDSNRSCCHLSVLFWPKTPVFGRNKELADLNSYSPYPITLPDSFINIRIRILPECLTEPRSPSLGFSLHRVGIGFNCIQSVNLNHDPF